MMIIQLKVVLDMLKYLTLSNVVYDTLECTIQCSVLHVRGKFDKIGTSIKHLRQIFKTKNNAPAEPEICFMV